MASCGSVFPDEELFSVPNKYDDLLSSFLSVCKFIELQANNRKKVVDLENETTFAKCSRAITTLSNSIGNISLACNKMRTTSMCLNRQNSAEHCEFIDIPYNIHLETVESLKEIYPSQAAYEDSKNVLLREANDEAANALIRAVESNIGELENFHILQDVNR